MHPHGKQMGERRSANGLAPPRRASRLKSVTSASCPGNKREKQLQRRRTCSRRVEYGRPPFRLQRVLLLAPDRARHLSTVLSEYKEMGSAFPPPTGSPRE